MENALQNQIDALEDKVWALQGVISALIYAVREEGLPLGHLHRHLATAANDIEDGFPGSAQYIDQLREIWRPAE